MTALPPRPVRRLLLPVVLVVQTAMVAVLLVICLAGLLAATVDRRRRLLRLAVLATWALGLELAALAALGVTWVLRPVRRATWYDDANRRVVAWVLDRLVLAAGRWVGFRVVIEEPAVPDPFGVPQPVLVLARHGGLGDSFTLVWLLLRWWERHPRVVLKEALCWDPLVDVALHRLGACFLRRGDGDRARQMASLAAGLADGEALLVFPEGMNWTASRRARTIGRLAARRRHRAARAAALMAHVLPARPTGVLACLGARPGLAIVVVAHTGLDHMTSVADVWRALPFATPMTVRWWPAAPAPPGEAARMDWLTTEWAVVDEWIDARAAAGARPDPAAGG